ncbi:MAG: DUF479 domain-containing protein [Planctomycetes bacterium]|nr:DUF479 domain-containing protein [Planctomycetota bacterium]
MNWLAHVLLSEADTEFRLGNLLADVVKGKARAGMSVGFLRGVRCHQAIDAFTDFHPIVHRSRARVAPPLRRYAGILVDIFYDHYLARDWTRYASIPLDAFTAEVYQSFRSCTCSLPAEAEIVLQRIIAEDRLGSYRELGGIETALTRLSGYLSGRWRRPIELQRGIADMVEHDGAFTRDFAEFFPLLVEHVNCRRQVPHGFA